MLGSQGNPGILHYALKEIFTQKTQSTSSRKMKVYISYLEIYNEILIDLLNPKGDPSGLKIKEDAKVKYSLSRWESL